MRKEFEENHGYYFLLPGFNDRLLDTYLAIKLGFQRLRDIAKVVSLADGNPVEHWKDNYTPRVKMLEGFDLVDTPARSCLIAKEPMKKTMFDAVFYETLVEVTKKKAPAYYRELTETFGD